MTQMWQTKKIDGYVPEFQMLLQEEKKTAKLYVGLVLAQGWTDAFSGGESTILSYDIDLSGKKEDSEEPKK
jgi:hypothetical protein